MSYLLDTHILLWALSNDDKLPKAARAIIGDDGNEVCYSIISTWEVALKHSAHPDQLTLTAQQMSLYCIAVQQDLSGWISARKISFISTAFKDRKTPRLIKTLLTGS